jgi:hypothetical protein
MWQQANVSKQISLIFFLVLLVRKNISKINQHQEPNATVSSPSQSYCKSRRREEKLYCWLNILCKKEPLQDKHSPANMICIPKKIMRANIVVLVVFVVWSLVNILFLTRIKFSESELENQLNELTLHYAQELKEYETKHATKCNLYSMVNNRKMQRKRTDYSSFRVFGGSHKNVTNRLLWHFKNVCYNAKNNRFEFYKNPNKLFDEPVLFNNGIHYKFPPLQYMADCWRQTTLLIWIFWRKCRLLLINSGHQRLPSG